MVALVNYYKNSSLYVYKMGVMLIIELIVKHICNK